MMKISDYNYVNTTEISMSLIGSLCKISDGKGKAVKNFISTLTYELHDPSNSDKNVSEFKREIYIKELEKIDGIFTSYANVLSKGFVFEGGKVLDAYYYPKSKEVWFILDDVNFEIRNNFMSKALDTWDTFGGEVIPIVTSIKNFNKSTMPTGAKNIKVN